MLVYFAYILILMLLALSFDLSPFSLSGKKSNTSFFGGGWVLFDAKSFVVLFAFILFLLLAFRDVSVGTDTLNYSKDYYSASTYQFPSSLLDFVKGEHGFKVLNYFFNTIGFGWLGFQIVYAAVVSVATGLFIYKYSKNVFNSAILFITVGNFSMSLTGVRQTIAVSLLLFCYLCIEKRKVVWSILLFITAITIHYSAMVGILYIVPFLSVSKDNIRPPLWLSISITIPIVSYFVTGKFLQNFSGILLNKYEYSGYFSTLNDSLNPIVLIMYWTMFLFIWVGSFINRNKCTQKDFYFLLLASMFLAALEASNTVYMMGRLSLYFSFFFIISMTNAIDCYPMPVSDKRITSFIICLFCIAAFAISTPGSSYGIDNFVFLGQ